MSRRLRALELLTAAQLAQFTTLTGSASARITANDATIDLQGKSITNVTIYSGNTTGSLFKVSSAAAAQQVFGGDGNDTLLVVGVALTADQRDVLFAVSSIETLIDTSGTYAAPAATPGLIRLTAGTDTLPTSPDSLTVNATATTLTAGDTLAAGATGTDVLAVYGTGTFNLNNYNVSGFEEFRLINNTTNQINFTVRSGQGGIVNSTGTGATYIQLSTVATTVTTGSGQDQIFGSSGATTVTTGAGSDYYYAGTGLANVDLGASNDYLYADYVGQFNGSSSYNGGDGSDQFLLYYGGRDLSGVTIQNFEYIYVAGESTMTSAQIAQFQSIQGGGVRINVADATLDLSNKSINSVVFGSLNATGTTFKVNSTSAAFQVFGGNGNDTLDAAALTLTAAQRDAIFNGSLLETINDATGTYAAPSLPAGTIKLTTGIDTLPAAPDSLTVLANAFTLNSGDILNGGATGTDVLALYGAGTFAFPTALSGFEQITLNNSSSAQATVYLRNGMTANLTSVGTGGVYVVGADTAVTLTLGTASDVVDMREGGITLDTGAGNDTVYGGSGLSNVNLGAGSDQFYLDLRGYNAASTFSGGADFDNLYVQNSRDLTGNGISGFEQLSIQNSAATVKITNMQLAQFQGVYGSNGSKITTSDVLFDLSGKNTNTVSFLSDNATGTLFKVSGATAGFQVVGGAGQDGVEAVGFTFTLDQRTALLNGASVEYIVEGTTIHGGSGANVLTGSAAANTIYGNGGNDSINGGAGTDLLYGGDGSDVFVFDTALTVANADTISDFVAGVDKIALAAAIFGDLPVGSLSAAAFTTGSAATTAAHRIVYEGATGKLWFDADGSGAGAAVLVATLTGQPTITAADFLVA